METTFSQTPVSYLLLVLIIGFSLWGWRNPFWFDRLLLHPWSFFREKRFYSLLTSGFVHANFIHLFFNLFTFYFFAFPLERILGSPRFLLVYLVALIVADLPSLWIHRNDPNYRSLGASGAVSGVVFGFILYFPKVKLYLFLLPFGIPAYLFAFFFLAGSYYLARERSSFINHSAHFWGAIAGLVMTMLVDPAAVTIFWNKMFG